MAQDIRIIDSTPEAQTLTSGNYVLLDSANGTSKYELYKIMQAIEGGAIHFADENDDGNITITIGT
jgi:hypothetical protein